MICRLIEFPHVTGQVSWQEQYSRRNCLLIHGITEGNQENTDALALEIFKEKLDIELTQRDLDRTHWTSKNDLDSNRPKLVIVKRISLRYSGDAYSFQCAMQLLIWGEMVMV